MFFALHIWVWTVKDGNGWSINRPPVYNHGKTTVGLKKLQQTSIYFCIWVIISLYHTSHFRASHERQKSLLINKKTILFLCSCLSRTGSWGEKCNTKQQWLLQVMLTSEKMKKTFTVLWVMRGHRLVWNGSYRFCVLSWPPSLQIPQLTTKFASAKLSHEAQIGSLICSLRIPNKNSSTLPKEFLLQAVACNTFLWRWYNRSVFHLR